MAEPGSPDVPPEKPEAYYGAESIKVLKGLDAARLRQTEITTAPDRRVMTRALLAAIGLFEEVSASVAAQRGFGRPDHAAVAAWLRAELAKLAD